LKTPDFTPEALASLAITIITNIIILWGVDIGAKREGALVSLVNGVFVIAFLFHSAIIRNGRAKVAAANATLIATKPVA
jgi:hypothetical protein